MAYPHISYSPNFDPEITAQRLGSLLVNGPLTDQDLAERIRRLDERFRISAARSPHHWEPGQVITNQVRGFCELYLPVSEIFAAINRLLNLSFQPGVRPSSSLFRQYQSWPDFLARLPGVTCSSNPATLLRKLSSDFTLRQRFVFALCLPRHYGGGFNRYPLQLAFLRKWLTEHKDRFSEEVRGLDAACGSGEGTYEAAILISAMGIAPHKCMMEGRSLDPVELFAGAHGWFPHDPLRQLDFRNRIDKHLAAGINELIVFSQEDIRASAARETLYDFILCNGLLGGPLLHQRDELQLVVAGLAGRVKPGGILLAADHFHSGWKQRVPKDLLWEICLNEGLHLLPVGEGLGGGKLSW